MYANKSGYYTFIGWNTNASGNGTWLADYGAINSPATFYAIYINTKWTYSYTGNSQSFTAPVAGTYRFVAKGGSGGSDGRAGGATVSGDIYLQKGTTLYVYVGGAGGDSTYSSTASGGWNGGGTGGKSLGDNEGTHVAGGGGGAYSTDGGGSGSSYVSGASWCSYTSGTGYKFSNISASEGSWKSGDAYAEITLIAR